MRISKTAAYSSYRPEPPRPWCSFAGRCTGNPPAGYACRPDNETRYSPGLCTGCSEVSVYGNPDLSKASTSQIERQNLTIRMGMRRMTRLTNAFSKKWTNLKSAYAIHFAYYNFCRVHTSLRVTPAMEARIADHVWTLGELIT